MTEKIHQGYVKISRKDHMATVEFFHPAHNSLPGKLLAQLKQAIEACNDDPGVQLVLLKSGGDRTFCAGASFDELARIRNTTDGKVFFMGFAEVINAIRKSSKIVIGRIHGKAVGGGVGLAAATDYTLATRYASVRLSELAVGIGPFVIGPAVERKVGMSAFSQMSLSPNEWRTAEWGKTRGLYQEVFQSTDQLDAYIDHFTESLMKMNPGALSQLKKIFWEGTDHWDRLLEDRAEMSGSLVLSDFAQNAISSFLKA